MSLVAVLTKGHLFATGIFLVLYLYLDRYIFYELSIETHKPKNEETNKHGIYKINPMKKLWLHYQASVFYIKLL